VPRHAIGCCLSLMIVGCASQDPLPTVRTAETVVQQAEPSSPRAKRTKTKKKYRRPSELAEQQERQVGVTGIEGTLSNFDVRTTLERRDRDFARCHEPRARDVPALAGRVEFQIHVLKSGEVGEVHTSASDLGDRVLERCFSEVIRGVTFPSPHGGEADVRWNMALEPAETLSSPEQWETRRVERVLKKHRSALLSTCDAHQAGPFTITAYVSRAGRVLAAGVAAPTVTSSDTLDCIAKELRSWSMPKPRKAIAKVSFPLRTGA